MAVACFPSLSELLCADIQEAALRPWDYLSPVIVPLMSPLYMIFMRYLFVYFREVSVALQDWIAANNQSCDCIWKRQLPEWRLSKNINDTDALLMTAVTFVGQRAGGCLGQPHRGLMLVCVHALAPCQGKENTWSWSPVLSVDIFGKGCWIRVCVWSYTTPSQVKHRETQRLLHFSV